MNTQLDPTREGSTGVQEQPPSLFENIATRVEGNNQLLLSAIVRLDNFLIAVEETTPTAENPPQDAQEVALHPRKRIIDMLDIQKAHVETLFELANRLNAIASLN